MVSASSARLMFFGRPRIIQLEWRFTTLPLRPFSGVSPINHMLVMDSGDVWTCTLATKKTSKIQRFVYQEHTKIYYHENANDLLSCKTGFSPEMLMHAWPRKLYCKYNCYKRWKYNDLDVLSGTRRRFIFMQHATIYYHAKHKNLLSFKTQRFIIMQNATI